MTHNVFHSSFFYLKNSMHKVAKSVVECLWTYELMAHFFCKFNMLLSLFTYYKISSMWVFKRILLYLANSMYFYFKFLNLWLSFAHCPRILDLDLPGKMGACSHSNDVLMMIGPAQKNILCGKLRKALQPEYHVRLTEQRKRVYIIFNSTSNPQKGTGFRAEYFISRFHF